MTQAARHVDHARDPDYVAAITAHRQARDKYLRTAADSPLRRPGVVIRALSYFTVDERYRIVVPNLRMPSGDERPIVFHTSDDDHRHLRRIAFLDFAIHDQTLTLTGFSLASTSPGTLFVPFGDATNGQQTYWSGRYLDLEIEPDGCVVLDFNLAYHPYCAYSSAYSCPLTPAENRLPVPIAAGERLRP